MYQGLPRSLFARTVKSGSDLVVEGGIQVTLVAPAAISG